MNCRPETRDAVRRFVTAADAQPRVVATDILTPEVSASGAYEAEIVVEGSAFSPALATAIGEHGLSVHDVATRGEPAHTVVTVRA